MAKRSIIVLRMQPDASNSFIHSCSLEVNTQWLKNRLAEANNGAVSLVVGARELTSWLSQSGTLRVPVFTVVAPNGQHSNLDLSLVLIKQAPELYNFSLSVLGQISALPPQPGFDCYLCNMVSGSVRLRLMNGFTSQFFQQQGIVSFQQWHDSLWKQPNVRVAGISFGARELELELLNSTVAVKNRSSVRLVCERGGASLWRLSDCGDSAFVRSADVLSEIQKNARRLLAAKNSGIRVAASPGGSDQVSGVFYYRRNADPVTLIRPDFAIEFSNDAGSRVWVPKTIEQDRGQVRFLDYDKVGSIINGVSVIDPSRTVFDAQWKRQSDRWKVQSVQYPAMACLGIDEGKLAEDNLWVFGRLIPNDPNQIPAMPCWTRIQLPELNASATKSEDSPGLVVSLDPGSDTWAFEISSDEAQASNVYRQDMLLVVSATDLKLSFFSGRVKAWSPSLYAFPNRLIDPTSPPNAKQFCTEFLQFRDAQSRLRLRPRRLRFEFRSDIDQLDCLKLTAGGAFDILGNGKVISHVPFFGEAIIDFLSPGANNLIQSIDPRTRRAVVERDATHTLLQIDLLSFRIASEGGLTASASALRANQKVAGAIALAPWIEAADKVRILQSETKARTLHHRNLALEHGEFAVASQDRSRNGEPQALANNLRDFVGAVRDEYTVAVPNLTENAATPGDIIHWAPGVRCRALQAYVEYLPPTSNLADRAPTIHLAGKEQSLRIGGDQQEDVLEWLTFNVRLQSVANEVHPTTGEKHLVPSLEVASTLPEEPSGRRGTLLARNASIPLLLDGLDQVAVCADSRSQAVDGLTWFVVLDSQGNVGIFDRTNGQRVEQLLRPQSSVANDARIPVAVANGQAADHADWIMAVYQDGTLVVWRRQSGSVSWLAPILHSVDANIRNASISSNHDQIALLLFDTNELRWMLLRWTLDSDDLVEVALPVQAGNDTVAQITALGHDLVLAMAGPSKLETWYGTSHASGWGFQTLSQAASVSELTNVSQLAFAVLQEKLYLGILRSTPKTWLLCQVSLVEGVNLVDQVVFTELDQHPLGLTLVGRPTGTDGLPVDCLPLWICVHHESGTVDLWLSTRRRELKSIDPQAESEFGGMLRPPYMRLRGQSDPVVDAKACCLQLSSPASHLQHLAAGLLTVAPDGFARIWHLDAGVEWMRLRDSSWLLDNLGALRSQSPMETEDFTVELVSWPETISASRDSSAWSHPEHGSLVCLTRVKDPTNEDHALVRFERGNSQDNVTNVHFFCEGLACRREGDHWVPVDLESDDSSSLDAGKVKLRKSRGHFGVFGFHSTLCKRFSGENVHEDSLASASTAYLPRIAGIPVFIHRIQSLSLDEPTSESPYRLRKLVVHAVLINPANLDALQLHTNDCKRGSLPAPVQQALSEGSTIVIEMLREADEPLRIDKVYSPSPIFWITNSDTSSTSSVTDDAQPAFRATLESLGFDVSFDRAAHRVLMQVSPEESRVATLGGSGRLAVDVVPLESSTSVVLMGSARRGSQVDYTFEFPSQAVSVNRNGVTTPVLPWPIRTPLYQFTGKISEIKQWSYQQTPERQELLTSGAKSLEHWDVSRGVRLAAHDLMQEPLKVALGRAKSQSDGHADVPHAVLALIASSDQPNGELQIIELSSGVCSATIPEMGNVSHCTFADREVAEELLATRGSWLYRWNTDDWNQLSETDFGSPLTCLTVCNELVIVARDGQSPVAWIVGQDPTVPANRLEGLVDHAVDHIAVVLGLDKDAGTYLVTLSGFEDTQRVTTLVEVSVRPTLQKVASTKLRFAETPVIHGLLWIDARLHAVAAGDNQTIDLWLLSDAPLQTPLLRWTQPCQTNNEHVLTLPVAGRYLTIAPQTISVYGVDGYLRISESGTVQAQLPVEVGTLLSSAELGFSVFLRLNFNDRLFLSKVSTKSDQMITLVSAATAHHSLFTAVFDLSGAGEGGTGVMSLWRTSSGKLGGSVLQSQSHSVSPVIKVLDENGASVSLQSKAEFSSMIVQTFDQSVTAQATAVRAVERTISGLVEVRMNESSQSSMRLLLIDQPLSPSQSMPGDEPARQRYRLTGFLDFHSQELVVQGPVAMTSSLNAAGELGSMEIILEEGVYRAAKVTIPQIDAVGADLMVAAPLSGDPQRGLEFDFRVPIRSPLPTQFVKIFGSSDGVVFRSVDSRQIPVDLCLDDNVTAPFPISSSTVPQLSHLTALATRLRFPKRENEMVNASHQGRMPLDAGHWLLQPVVRLADTLRILDAGVAATISLAEPTQCRTENILAMIRPARLVEPSVKCLASRSSLLSDAELFSGQEFVELQRNRLVLVRMVRQGLGTAWLSVIPGDAASSESRLEGQQRSVSRSDDNEATRWLTHFQAMNWMPDPQHASVRVLPDSTSSTRDNSRVAQREFLLGSPRATRKLSYQAGDGAPDRYHFIVQEATAFADMPRLWHNPLVEDLTPLAEILPPPPDPHQTPPVPLFNNPSAFEPTQMRFQLAADKPGAMIHHSFQFMRSPAEQNDSRLIRLRSRVGFALREPMQITPPAGASLAFVPEQTLVNAAADDFVNIRLRWKETLGQVQATAQGEMSIEQLPTQITSPVALEDVQLRFKSGADRFLQTIVRINDEVRDIDARQPFFPVYDARQVAKSFAEITTANFIGKIEHDQSEVMELQLALGARPAVARISSDQTQVWDLSRLGYETSASTTWSHEVVSPVVVGSWDAVATLIGVQRTDGAGAAITPTLKQWPALGSLESGATLNIGLASAELNLLSALALGTMAVAPDQERDCLVAVVNRNQLCFGFRQEDSDTLQTCRLTMSGAVQVNRVQILRDASQLREVSVVAWFQDDTPSSQSTSGTVCQWRIRLSDAGELAGTDVIGERLELGSGMRMTAGIIGGLTNFFLQTTETQIKQFDAQGHQLNAKTMAQPVTHLSLDNNRGKSLLTICCSNSITIWAVPQWRELRALTLSVTQTSAQAQILSLAGRSLLVAQAQPKSLEFFDLLFSLQAPPNVFLISSLASLDPVMIEGIKVKDLDDYKAELEPCLVVESKSSTNQTTQNVRQTFRLVQQLADRKLCLYQLNEQSSAAFAQVDWSTAKSVRVSWVGKLSPMNATSTSGIRDIEVVYGGADGKKQVQLVPYDMTGAKVAVVLVADQETSGFVKQVLARTILFGDAANASEGTGQLTPNLQGAIFRFEAESSDSVDLGLPVFVGRKLGLILVKYFADGQTLSTSMKISN